MYVAIYICIYIALCRWPVCSLAANARLTRRMLTECADQCEQIHSRTQARRYVSSYVSLVGTRVQSIQ